MTNQGKPKREFALGDDAGAWLHGCAIGRHAENHKLRGNMEVLFFCSGCAAIGAQKDCIMLSVDVVIVPVGLRRGPVIKKTQVCITHSDC